MLGAGKNIALATRLATSPVSPAGGNAEARILTFRPSSTPPRYPAGLPPPRTFGVAASREAAALTLIQGSEAAGKKTAILGIARWALPFLGRLGIEEILAAVSGPYGWAANVMGGALALYFEFRSCQWDHWAQQRLLIFNSSRPLPRPDDYPKDEQLQAFVTDIRDYRLSVQRSLRNSQNECSKKFLQEAVQLGPKIRRLKGGIENLNFSIQTVGPNDYAIVLKNLLSLVEEFTTGLQQMEQECFSNPLLWPNWKEARRQLQEVLYKITSMINNLPGKLRNEAVLFLMERADRLQMILNLMKYLGSP